MAVKVSIVTPAFNRKDLLPLTLDSVLGQSFGDFEYIVVDDGSSDGTYEWLCRLTDPRVKVLTHEGRANRGQAASVNLGLEAARGQFLVILDSDDLLASDALESHLAEMKRDRSIGVVYGQGFAIDLNGERLYPLFPEGHREDSDPNKLLLDCYVASPGMCMFRKEVVEKVGLLEESFRAAQDHDFLLRVAEASKVAFSPRVTFFYRKHDGTISAKGQLTRWSNGFEILRRARKRFPYKASTVRKRLAVLNYRMGEVYWSQGQRILAARYLVKSGILDPARAISFVARGFR